MYHHLETLKDELINIEIEGESENCIYNAAEPVLQNMPVEIILRICSFLDTEFLSNTFRKVCIRFAEILADDHIWKRRVHSKMKSSFPPLPQLDVWQELDWQGICVDIATGEREWTNGIRHVQIKDAHTAPVDALLLFNNGQLCLSGSRDRNMALWDVLAIKAHDLPYHRTGVTYDRDIIYEIPPKHVRHDAHIGWIWDLLPDNIDNALTIFSGSWDGTVKAWDLTTGLTCIETYKCGMASLALLTNGHNELISGIYTRKILTFDRRVGPEPVHSYKPHIGPVLRLALRDNKIVSLSEDRTLAVWDKVAGKLVHSKVKLPMKRPFPASVSWTSRGLYIGDSHGAVHLLHPEKYTHVTSYQIWPMPGSAKPYCKVQIVYDTEGQMFLGSEHGDIKFCYNSYPPQEYAELNTNTFDITEMRYHNGVFVAGGCDPAIEFFISDTVL